MSYNTGSLSPNSRSKAPVTLGDFMKIRKPKTKKNASPDSASVRILRRPSPEGVCNYSSLRTFLPRENQIDFSVNDIDFDKVENHHEEEIKWSENDVDFTAEQKPCSPLSLNGQKIMLASTPSQTGDLHSLKNDSGFQAFNNFRLNSYTSDESDINFNNEHLYLPDPQQYTEHGTTYFPFERVEEDTYYGADEGYYGTTYYQGDGLYYFDNPEAVEEQQVVPGSQDLQIAENVSEIENILETLLGLAISSGEEESLEDKDKAIEKDEELNNLVLSIIDDE